MSPALRLLLPLAAAAGLTLAGCASEALLIPTADGHQAVLARGSHGIEWAQNDDMQIGAARVELVRGSPRIAYILGFMAKPGFVPVRVAVDDVTDNPIVPLVEDDAPHLVRGMWVCAQRPRDVKDPGVKWLLTVDDSIEVFRFAVTGADGRVSVLYQPVVFPAMLKTAVRHVLGLNY